MASFPAGLKPVKPYLSVAKEHDARDPVVAYYCRRYALEKAMPLPNMQAEDKKFLLTIMDQLEQSKKELAANEAFKSEIVAQAHLENHALKVFLWADNEDRRGIFNKNVVKSFYTSSLLFDVISTFEEPTEEIEKTKKYAKWKATYINQCLKTGETPQPGPLDDGLQPGMHPSNSAPDPGISPYPPNQPAATGGYPPPQQPGGYPPPQQPGASAYPPPGGFPPQQPGGFPPQQPGGYPQANNHLQPGAVPPGLHAPPSTPEQGGWNQEGGGIPGPAAASQSGASLATADFTKAQKYCKYASSALQYEDTPTAIENLEKALRLLKTGKE